MLVLSDSDRLLLDSAVTARILELRRRAILVVNSASSARLLAEADDLVELRGRLWGRRNGTPRSTTIALPYR